MKVANDIQRQNLLGLMEDRGGGHWALPPAFISVVWLSFSGLGFEITGWLIVFSGLMASYDLASRRIPNAITAVLALTGLAWGLAEGGLPGLWASLLGGLTGFSLMAFFFFIGAVGAGDVKALGALSTFLSPYLALTLFCLTTVIGGVLALSIIARAGLRSRRSGSKPADLSQVLGNALAGIKTGPSGLSMPYGLAILGGVVAMAAIGVIR